MTATDLVMMVMEDFSKAEAKSMVIVWTNQDGDICIASNCDDSECIGLAEYAKHRALRRQLKVAEEANNE